MYYMLLYSIVVLFGIAHCHCGNGGSLPFWGYEANCHGGEVAHCHCGERKVITIVGR